MADVPPPYKQDPPYPQTQGQQPYPPQQQATTIVVTNQTAVTPVVFRDVPVLMTDAAGNQFTTQLDYRIGAMTWLIVALLVLFGFWCLFCIPFFIDSLKDVYHINPNNGTVVGVYKRLG